MICCDGKCNQGRRCPRRPTREPNKAFLYTVVIVIILIVLGVVGRMDYDAAKVTEQTMRQGASQSR